MTNGGSKSHGSPKTERWQKGQGTSSRQTKPQPQAADSKPKDEKEKSDDK